MPGLKSYSKYGSIFEKTKPVIKTRHVLGKNIDPSLVSDLLNGRRMEWDKNLAEFKEIAKVSPDVSVIHSVLKGKTLVFQARDFVEKKVQFYDCGAWYAYFSSVPDELLPVIATYTRGETIFSVSMICMEDGDCVFYSISQTDMKVFLFQIYNII